MRFSALLAAVLLATAPLLSGCDAAGPDADAAPALAQASSMEAKTMTCERFLRSDGQDQSASVDPGDVVTFRFDVEPCGRTIFGTPQWTVTGDASNYNGPIIDDLEMPSRTIQADNVPGGSFVVRIDYTYSEGEISDSHYVTVSITGGDDDGGGDTDLLNLDVTATGGSSSVTVTWDPTQVDPEATGCRILMKHTERGQGLVHSVRRATVDCQSGQYVDLDHQGAGPGLEMVDYVLNVIGQSGGGPPYLKVLLQTDSSQIFAIEANPAFSAR